MNYPKNRFLFTIKDISKACGVSRATLLRMEESGFLTPCKVDENTGYRYYDANNIAQIGQYQLLQELGLSRKEITDLYLRRIDIAPFIDEQRQKIHRLQRALNELELRYTKKNELRFSFIELPEITCICQTIPMNSVENLKTIMYDMYQKTFQEGFRINGKEPLFACIANDTLATFNLDDSSTDITLCIPVMNQQASDPRITVLPACYACSLISYGNTSTPPEIVKQFLEEVTRRKLRPIGPLRINLLVAPYTGMHISEDDYCYEYVLPIERNL